MSDFVSKPVLRGFAFGLALTIAIKQLPTILGVHSHYTDTLRIAFDLARQVSSWNFYSVALGAVALAILFGLGRSARMPATLAVIVLGIALGYRIDWHGHGIGTVGVISFHDMTVGLPRFDRSQWLQTAELAFALMLIL